MTKQRVRSLAKNAGMGLAIVSMVGTLGKEYFTLEETKVKMAVQYNAFKKDSTRRNHQEEWSNNVIDSLECETKVLDSMVKNKKHKCNN